MDIQSLIPEIEESVRQCLSVLESFDELEEGGYPEQGDHTGIACLEGRRRVYGKILRRIRAEIGDIIWHRIIEEHEQARGQVLTGEALKKLLERLDEKFNPKTNLPGGHGGQT